MSESERDLILLAAQPIYRYDMSLFGSELLYRDPDSKSALEVGEVFATREVVLNLCSSVSTQMETLNRPVFINISKDFLLSEAFLPLNPDLVFIELVERIKVDEAVVKSVMAWKRKGFHFALDDFEFDESWQPLLELAEVIKIDVMEQDVEKIRAFKEKYRYLDAKWLAEKVENDEEFQTYKAMGFEYFQGYFLARPKLIHGKKIRPEQGTLVQILKVLNDESADIDSITSVVSRSPKLSMQLLRIINSSLYTLNKDVSSLQEAIVFLGLETLKYWAILFSFMSASDSPVEVFRLAMIRAKACEFYCTSLNLPKATTGKAFLIGLLSATDILLGIKTREFINLVDLTEEVSAALTRMEGDLGKVLKHVLITEQQILKGEDFQSSMRLTVAFNRAFLWTEEVIQEMERL
ncbi:EAL and HDOD domain-containing protein [Gynuella sp.]|uniref:EAL and HDOD domain-containing protein n=1 Tax=Gynuella sp. TaxID=2969146 RepID=UPI003D0FFDF0